MMRAVTEQPARSEEQLRVGDLALHLEHHRPTDGRVAAALVMVHGFAAHCGLYRHVATALAAQGIAVTSFDCRGHGRSEGRRAYVPRFSRYLDDLEAILRRARELSPGVPLVLMGHSHGGTIALSYVLEGRPAPDRLVLAAPWIALRMPLPTWKRAIAPVVALVWPTLAVANEIRGADVSRNPEVVENFEKDPLVLRLATARWFHEVRLAQARIRSAAHRLQLPTLLQVAGDDRIVDTEAALAFAAAAGGPVKVLRYESLYHELFLEPERQQVIADIGAWVLASDAAATDLARASKLVPGII
jgi:alpha-beta hydrolase superfamily lysophospholipase